jgi:quinol monooxygenase YgiN
MTLDGPVSYFVRMRALEGCAERVLALLLTNPTRIEEGEPGNLAFAVHRSREEPDEFWLYETWEDQAAVERHESANDFMAYKEELRPLQEQPYLGDEVGQVLQRVVEVVLPERRELEVLAHMGRDR